MKNIFLGILACAMLAGCSAPMQTTVSAGAETGYQQPPPQDQYGSNQYEGSYQVFYDQLGQYGNWIDYPEYGYVWQPNVDQDFRPYETNGHWVYSDGGWTWASDYPWGWAAFHYGRWFYEDGYGWLWVPGHQWAPAWVTWGQSGNYYGWAPLAPNVDASDNSWTPPANTWNFVPAERVTTRNVANYAVVQKTNTTEVNNIVKNVTIINNTSTVNNSYVTNNVNKSTVTNNNTTNNTNVTNNNTVNNTNVTNNNVVVNKTVYNKGPEVKQVEAATNEKVQKVNIQPNNKPGATVVNNNKLVIYRPAIKPPVQQPAGNNKPKPQQVQPFQKKAPNSPPANPPANRPNNQ